MSGTEAQNAWIGRVLGVRPDGSGGGLSGGGLIELGYTVDSRAYYM